MGITGGQFISQKRVGQFYSSAQTGQITAGASATIMVGYGIYAGNTLTADNTRTKGANQYGRFYQAITSAVSGNNAGQTHNDVAFRMDQPHTTEHAMGISSAAAIRVFCGQIEGTGVNFSNCVDANTLGGKGFGFQFSTPRGDTTWQFITYDGTTQTVADTGVTVTANVLYQFQIEVVSSTEVYWEVYDSVGVLSASGTATATLPSSTTTFLSAQAIETETTATKGLFTYLIGAFSQGFMRP
jgi:hypothetical protein